jgi:hypothetical protein
LPARPPTFGRFIILGAVAAITATVVLAAWLNQPPMRDYPSYTAIDLSECAYQQAADAAKEAADRYYKPSAPLSKAASARALHEAEAAKQKQEDARVCEDRKRQDSDLSAQWHSAVAAENTARFTAAGYWWGVLELVFLFMALGAACWAALEGKRAADAAHAQHVHARLESLRERRAAFNQAIKDKATQILQAEKHAAEATMLKERFEQQLGAAKEAASNTLVVGKAQARAYLSLGEADVTVSSVWGGGSEETWFVAFDVAVTVHNSGQSPARSLRVELTGQWEYADVTQKAITSEGPALDIAAQTAAKPSGYVHTHMLEDATDISLFDHLSVQVRIFGVDVFNEPIEARGKYVLFWDHGVDRRTPQRMITII